MQTHLSGIEMLGQDRCR